MAAYRSLSAAADEAEEPRYNACGASSYRGLAAEAEEEEASSLLSFERDLPGAAGGERLGHRQRRRAHDLAENDDAGEIGPVRRERVVMHSYAWKVI